MTSLLKNAHPDTPTNPLDNPEKIRTIGRENICSYGLSTLCQSSQQGIEWQGSARVHGERHGRVAARRAEAAHLFPAINSTISMMLSAESGAAGSDNVGALPRT